ncbi:conserved hypothetical protein [Nitrosococcus oceani ATCC 19707]|uniref:Uncharacterized protein n=2 Tax=Nitrosococcus oceani TaxID=1229 RepID=Q3J6W9_NITOC|nr:hypothetical protein [Nitrosococcus oceani]ABA59427.1 conserved hypothetical protein [Nitrosococcus oceani ATCC 19707]EDZ65373.1 hypothetical protein NOC27_2053 [Nitrosococcus oceani AFC27]KFI18169.1 hypothetical protein IB75_15865 [Nitrosococcus oceani C-27]GEM20002.1 hypothetical protein NONS58_14060 [Nitrosococcus oceani]
MGNNRRYPELVTRSELRPFFYDSLQEAVANQHVKVDEATVFYLVNLLTDFSRSEKIFDYTQEGPILRPLAELYGFAAGAASQSERKLILQRLGDVALFISGLFSGYFRRRLVDVDYYIAMGGSAYGYLYDIKGQNARERALATIFRQLSQQFVQFVDVLAEVGENAFGSSEQDILDLYELWAKTGSPRLERRLRCLGINPQHSGPIH